MGTLVLGRLEFEDTVDSDGELEIVHDDCGDYLSEYITKVDAEEIINHLTKVFNI